MPVPPANLPRLVPEKPPVLDLKDVGILLQLARAEISSGLRSGKQAGAALEVLSAVARVEAWHHYESAHRNTRYGDATAPQAGQVSRGGPGSGPQGVGDGDPGAGTDAPPGPEGGDLQGVPPIEAR